MTFYFALSAALLCFTGALAAFSLDQKANAALLALSGLLLALGGSIRNPRRAETALERRFSVPRAAFLALGLLLLALGQVIMLKGPSPTAKGGQFLSSVWGLGLSGAGAGLLLAYFLLPGGGWALRLRGVSSGLLLAVAGLVYLAWAGAFVYRSTAESTSTSGRVFILFDDAMVSLRYAWNLAHGQGLVWNPGERIEGFTNLLMTLLMSVGCWFLDKYRAAAFPQLLGIGFILGAAWQARAVFLKVSGLADDKLRQAAAALVFIAALAYYPLSYWTLLGMETGLLSVLLCSALAVYVRAEEKTSLWLPVLLGLAVMTRPDTMAQAGLILGFRALYLMRRGAWSAVAREALVFAAFPAGVLAFRHAYYGEWVPNTYYLKLTGLDRDIRLQSGMAYTRQLLPSLMLLLGLAVAGLAARFNTRKLLLAGLVASILAYQTWVGGDAWLYWRFFCPYFPLLALLAVEGAAQIVALLWKALPAASSLLAPQWRLAVLAACVPLTAGMLAADKSFGKEILFTEGAMSVEYNRANMNTGLALKRVLLPGAKVGVTWAGVIPYFSGHIGVDFLGKCDKQIAQMKAQMVGFNGMPSVPGHNKYDLHYSIEQLKPDFVQTHYWGGDDLLAYTDANYVRRENILIRKDSPYVNWDAFIDGLGKPDLKPSKGPK
jgi:arabinofuranosyltransferase